VTTAAAPPAIGVPLGLGLGRLTITIDGPRSRTTHREVETISGSVTGGTATRLVLHANGIARDVSGLAGSSFELPVTLRPGANHLRVVAVDARGMESDDAVTVEYVPPPVERVVLTAPRDGHTLGADAPPFVVVEGTVDDPSVKSVAIVANGRRTLAAAEAGRFRHLLPVTAPDIRLWAEAVIGGQLHKSRMVTIGGPPVASLGAIVIEWPVEAIDVLAEVTAAWRPDPGRLDVPGRSTTLVAFRPEGASAPGVFYLRNPRPGVYTFVLRYQATGPVGEAAVSVLVPDATGLVTKRLAPLRLGTSGRTRVARVLLPQGILWEEDDWFTGHSQGAETITKFKLPEGITWTERRGDLP
jgi:hypothetical protein